MNKLEFISHDTHFSPKYAVVFLHGLGADGHDIGQVFHLISLPKSYSTKFIAPHAPGRHVTINGGTYTRAWYDILQLSDLNGPVDEQGLRESIQSIHKLLHNLERQGYPSERISLMGFSQGGALAYWAGLTYPRKLRYLAALSAYLPRPGRLWGRNW